MKQKRTIHLSLRFRFTLLIMAEIVMVVVAASVTTWLFRRFFQYTIDISPLIWLLVLSAVIGGAVTNFFGKRFFVPITRLSQAMNTVAGGDFTVRLESAGEFKEIQEIYANFNLMVQELGATEVLQTDFVSGVSHEFKTPIGAIEGYATLLQDGSQTEQERAQYIDKILLNTKRLSKLVGNILLLSKVDNQAIQSGQTHFRLDEQIRQSIILLEPAWTDKEIEFDVDLERVEYLGNESLLMHVWNNLIGNAIKFDPQGGFVRIRLKRRGGQIIFTIEDNGPGINEGAIKHIFDKFYQADSSHKEEGNGLGLALVRQILTIYSGEITAENLLAGGCRFTIILPAP